MSENLAVTNHVASLQEWSQEQVDLIKNTVAKGATNDELAMFVGIARKYGLDPFVKEIWFIKRAKKVKDRSGNWDYKRLENGEIDYSDAETMMMTSRDGYLKVAQRDPLFDGIISFAIREGDLFEIDAENYKVTHKFGMKRGPIIGAWAKVDHKNRKPVISFADFKEYNQANSTTWKQYPSAMIQKVAEVLALKRQFGISGLVTQEEINYKMEDIQEPETPIVIEPTITDDDIKGIADLLYDGIDREMEDKEQLKVLKEERNCILKIVLDEFGYLQTKTIQVKDLEKICNKIKEFVRELKEVKAEKIVQDMKEVEEVENRDATTEHEELEHQRADV